MVKDFDFFHIYVNLIKRVNTKFFHSFTKQNFFFNLACCLCVELNVQPRLEVMVWKTRYNLACILMSVFVFDKQARECGAVNQATWIISFDRHSKAKSS